MRLLEDGAELDPEERAAFLAEVRRMRAVQSALVDAGPIDLGGGASVRFVAAGRLCPKCGADAPWSVAFYGEAAEPYNGECVPCLRKMGYDAYERPR